MKVCSSRSSPSSRVSAEVLSRARWRARRGLLENDLVIERFFERYGATLDEADIRALDRLFMLADSDLFDLLLARTELPADLALPENAKMLALLRETTF